MKPSKRFVKTDDQKKALSLLAGKAPNVLLYGGSRSGKTFISIYAIFVRALKSPGSRHAILRFHTNAVRRSILNDTLPRVLELCFPRLKYKENKTDGFLRLPNGSELWFSGLEQADRAEKILGREFATLYFNECSELEYSAVNTALTRLAQKTTLKNRAYFDCNPPGKSHWTYQLFFRHLDPLTREILPYPELYAAMLMNPAGNAANLPNGYLTNTLAGLSARQRERFLEGRFLDDIEGALWKREWIDRTRLVTLPVTVDRLVIGVDPAVTGGENSDRCGIIAAARGEDGDYYILADRSTRGSVLGWIQTVCRLYRELQADRVIGEVNNGGDLIETALRNECPDIPFRAVRATRGKLARAEPVAALYEAGKVHHIGSYPDLEEELCSYAPGHILHSPDRMDAVVWALTELSEAPKEYRFFTV